MNPYNSYEITYNVQKRQFLEIKFKQGDRDSSVLELSLVSGAVPIDISGCTVIQFKFNKPDGTSCYQDLATGVSIIDGPNGVVRCEMVTNTLAAVGYVNCEIELITATQEKLTTPTFKFEVLPSLDAENFLSGNYVGAIESGIITTTENAASALASKQAASISEVNAAASELASAASESNSALSEDNAKTSEDNSKASELAADLSEANARASELAAKASELAASSSEASALQSANNSEASAASILDAEANSLASEQAAKVSEDNAKASELASKTSETNSKTSETNSKASELNAGSSETTTTQTMQDFLAMMGTDVPVMVGGKIQIENIPDRALINVHKVGTAAARLELTAQPGDVAVVVVIENEIEVTNESYWLLGTNPALASDWVKVGVSYVPEAGHAVNADVAANAVMINEHRIVEMDAASFAVAVKDPSTYYLVY